MNVGGRVIIDGGMYARGLMESNGMIVYGTLDIEGDLSMSTSVLEAYNLTASNTVRAVNARTKNIYNDGKFERAPKYLNVNNSVVISSSFDINEGCDWVLDRSYFKGGATEIITLYDKGDYTGNLKVNLTIIDTGYTKSSTTGQTIADTIVIRACEFADKNKYLYMLSEPNNNGVLYIKGRALINVELEYNSYVRKLRTQDSEYYGIYHSRWVIKSVNRIPLPIDYY